MAIKGIVTIDSYMMNEDHTFNVVCTMCDSTHHMTGLTPASGFSTSATSLQVNEAVRDAAVAYMEAEWSVSFNPLLDTVKIVNPANLLNL